MTDLMEDRPTATDATEATRRRSRNRLGEPSFSRVAADVGRHARTVEALSEAHGGYFDAAKYMTETLNIPRSAVLLALAVALAEGDEDFVHFRNLIEDNDDD